MGKYALIGDSTCDLTPKMRKDNDIDYLRMMVSWTGKDRKTREIYASLDWEVFSPKQYYGLMRAGYRLNTSQVIEKEFDDVFGRHLDKGEDILYLGCSSALSSSVRRARKLTEEKYSKRYPDRKIIIIDSLCSCLGQGMMLLDAARMRREGKTLAETARYLEDNKLRYNQVATVESLEYLARSGRIKAAKSFFGNIFGVKPLFISDADGNNLTVGKAKGRRNALIKMAGMVKERVIDPERQTCYVAEADCKETDLELLRMKLMDVCGFKDVSISTLGPIIGATCGPGTIGIYFLGRKETRVG